MENGFNRKLRKIIGQGNTKKSYRDLIRDIFRIQREEFFEDNLITSEYYFKELVNDAINEEYRKCNVIRADQTKE
jgi:hypothetical protein